MSAPKIMQEFMMKHHNQQALLKHEAVQNLNTLIDRAVNDDSLIDKAILVFKQFDAVNLEKVFDADNRWAEVFVKRCPELLKIFLETSGHALCATEAFLDALLNTNKVEIEDNMTGTFFGWGGLGGIPTQWTTAKTVHADGHVTESTTIDKIMPNPKIVVGIDTFKKANAIIDSIQDNAVRLKLEERLVNDMYLRRQRHKFFLSETDIKTLKEFVPSTTAKVNQTTINQSNASTSAAIAVHTSNTAANPNAAAGSIATNFTNHLLNDSKSSNKIH